jgi:hypothetical protein
MSVDIFYRSYSGDFNWLALSLLSVKKYAHGFGKVHIAIPASDIGLLPKCDGEVHLIEPKAKDGYMDQQITKLYADEFCKAEYVMHLDSDCILTKDVSPMDLFLDGKPVYLREDGCVSPWMDISARSLGWRDSYEYMRRLPITYPRWLYGEFRAFMASKHGMSLDQWVANQPGHEFSEFNTMGQWAYEFHRSEFTWLEPKDVPSFCKQYRSWDGLTDEAREQIKVILAD